MANDPAGVLTVDGFWPRRSVTRAGQGQSRRSRIRPVDRLGGCCLIEDPATSVAAPEELFVVSGVPGSRSEDALEPELL